MSKTKDEAPKAPAPPSLAKSIAGYVIGAGLGLVALFVLSTLLRGAPASQDELPHLAVLVHAPGPDGFADPAARRALSKLHKDLVALGDLNVLGPNDYPVVSAGATPRVLALDSLTKDELLGCAPYFAAGNYLTRVLSPDLRYAVLRAAPRSGPFARGTAGRVEALLDEVTGEGLLRATAYSQALQLAGDADVKATLNLYFGVQTVVVHFVPKDKGGAAKLDSILEVHKAARAFERPSVRSVSTEATFLHYAVAVQSGDPKLAAIPEHLGADKLQPLLLLGRAAKVPGYVSQDGSWAVVELATEAEELQNRELGYDFRANAPTLGSGSFQFRRAK